ncbi:ATP-dependent RNA helicase DDX60 [Nematocida homosporus]|uniref:ATP-dependent RNA helicase DDX60 n=1 Tax=Nematocida homosporus TaxID=1912981 RepID=UPI00221F51F0|nr:ATP-dependent RNA helicase DDX60 [Nematocida homosporus]KAI5187170.1 ATP-dependent RNA helicase DDX60 [Nematocida homosporus]
MTRESMEMNKQRIWYSNTPIKMVDISETFVGIGKIVISGRALYRYIEETYGLVSASLPLALVRKIAESISYNLMIAGFKESYIVMFRDEEEEGAVSICTRECISVLAADGDLPVLWFSSARSSEFVKFLKDEHICLVTAYHDDRSLAFLNMVLGLSLYAGILSPTTFRAPRLYLFVLDPSQYNHDLSIELSERCSGEVSGTCSSEVNGDIELEVNRLVESYYGQEKAAHVKNVLVNGKGLKYYPTERPQALPKEVVSGIYQTIRSTETLVLSDSLDGVLLQSNEPEHSLAIPDSLEPSSTSSSSYLPTQMATVTFYNEEQEKTFRAEQMYIESLKKTAQSLHEGKHLHPPISLVTAKPDKKKKETKEKISKKQQEIIDRNNLQKEQEAKKKDIAFLKSFLAKYQAFATVYEKRRHLESFVPRIHSPFICLKVLLLRLEFYLDLWALEKRKKRPNEKDLVSIYMDALTFVEKYQNLASLTELEYVLQTLLDLGFAATVLEVCQKYQISYTNKRDPNSQMLFAKRTPVSLSFDPEATSAPNDFDISFLMRSAGDKLKRSLNSRPDHRLLFEPDEWQVKLLQIVDADESAVICAPTSTGKTFICYYAMERILRESNDDVVIFVAPTKALVNQVAADVYARFGSKPYIKQNNILQGICMGDFQISPFNCQVLITVPEVLEKILTMPPETKKKERPYLERLRYIIIDEVHKISDSKMGASLEKIIHFSPCPILLLSATLGNLKEFHRWVQSIEAQKGRECFLVQHKERYCEIKNYVFVPKKIEKLTTCHKTTRELGEPSLALIHSLFAYSFRNIKDDGFSDDVNFLPEELLNLYYAIFAVLRKDQRHLVKKFRPQRFFTTNCITKSDVKQYESHVIETFCNLVKDGLLEPPQVSKIYDILIREAKEGFQKIEADLTAKLQAFQKKHHLEKLAATASTTTSPLEEQEKDQPSPEQLADLQNMQISSFVSPDIMLYNLDYLLDNILDLVVELEAKNMLPCIIFNLERVVCNALAIRLVEELDKHEKIADPILTKNDLRENEKILKEMKRARDAAIATGKDSWIGESMIAEEMSSRNVDPNAKDPRFCFTDPSTVSSGAYVLDEYAKSLKKAGKIDSRFIHALYRGIGIHHTGTPKKYRNMVEILFRMKQLRVIFATETLALGINMPCKTAVFAGDSLSLDAMGFKQMAGRAGRRGYDTQGNVVFFGIPKQKIQSLITSYLPNIKGSYPYTNALSVQAARPTTPAAVVDSFVQFPLISFAYPAKAFAGTDTESGPEFRQRLLLEQKKNLIAHSFLAPEVLTAETKNLAHISALADVPISNLSYDAESFVLMGLIKKGLLDKLCLAPSTIEVPANSNAFNRPVDKDEIAKRIIHLLASIFEIYPLPKGSALRQLEPLPDYLDQALHQAHEESLSLAKRFMSETEKDLCRVLQDKFSPTVAASSFFALPHIHTPKSAYIVEYFEQAKVSSVLKSTGMGETALWQRLKRIENLLTSLSVYYHKYQPDSVSASHVEYTEKLFRERFAKMHA